MVNKKYYWLKLKDDFFTQPKIKKLRKIAGGDTYTIIYLKMQLLSLKNEGKLYFEEVEENFVEELALTLDEDVENVKVTVGYLMAQGLLEEVLQDEFALIETMQNIGSESASTVRSRRSREKQKALQCNTNATNCNTEKEKEIRERDKREDTQKEKKETFVSVIADFTDNDDLISSLKSYVEMRKRTKGFTVHALKLNLKTLKSLSDNPHEQIQIVNQSIEKTWKSFYELKTPYQRNQPQQKGENIFLEMLKEEESKKDSFDIFT